jgi:hypothetical protein
VPFEQIVRKIEASEPPYMPEYSGDEEPPFLTEWQEAALGLTILGQACVSMLSAALKPYFETWESELRVGWEPNERERHCKRRFIQAYKCCFEELLLISWAECPADFDPPEQITLAPNAPQHPKHITAIEGRHDMKTRARYPSPFFVSEMEKHLVSVENLLAEWFAPSIDVSQKHLADAADEVEKLTGWLEERLLEAAAIRLGFLPRN